MSETANPERGEISLELEGVAYVLRPSYEAIQAFEAQSGKSLLDLAQAAADGRLTLSEIASIACECIRAWGRSKADEMVARVNANAIGNLIYESPGGIMLVTQRLAVMLIMASSGGYTATGEVKATATN